MPESANKIVIVAVIEPVLATILGITSVPNVVTLDLTVDMNLAVPPVYSTPMELRLLPAYQMTSKL